MLIIYIVKDVWLNRRGRARGGKSHFYCGVETFRVHTAAIQSLPKCSHICEQLLTGLHTASAPIKSESGAAASPLHLKASHCSQKTQKQRPSKLFCLWYFKHTQTPLYDQEQLTSPSRRSQRSQSMMLFLEICIFQREKRDLLPASSSDAFSIHCVSRFQ